MELELRFAWNLAAGVVLIVEDGSIVAGANTFVTVEEYKAYAVQRGWPLPPSDLEIARAILSAADFIRSLEPKFAGYRVSNEQTMPFPRKGVAVPGRPGWYYDEDEIPSLLKEAQIELAGIVASGGRLYPSASSLKAVKRKKIGPIETEYFEGSVAGDWTSAAPAAYALLIQLMGGGYPGYMTSRRV